MRDECSLLRGEGIRKHLIASALGLLIASGAFAFEQPALPSDRSAVRELRLGVICYGGVSLAIYMYGMTRELHHLAMASAALECDAQGDAATCGDVAAGEAWQALPASAQAYYAALAESWQEEKVRTRVVVDVISGTSAGGINGIILAKALAHNRPVLGLRRLWFEEADISRLATGRPWFLRAALRLLRGKSALGGDAWLRQLYLAFNEMDDPNNDPALAFPSLMPPGQPLDLLVTATDFYGSDRLLEIGDPASSWETRHDHVFRFSFARGADGAISATHFDRSSNISLAFAARSSASFPVAFPAIRLEDLAQALGEPVDAPALARRLFSERLAERHDPDAAAALAGSLYLVDGGVLDNYPFAIAYRRISRRAPVLETRRVFLYLEPDPRIPPDLDAPPVPAKGNRRADGPSALQMFWNAKASIPGAEPIVKDLLEIVQHNRRVDRIAEILRRDEEIARAEYAGGGGQDVSSVASRIEKTLQMDTNALAHPAALGERLSKLASSGERSEAPREAVPQAESPASERALEEIQRMRLQVEVDAAAGLPIMEEAYIRLRVHSVIDQLGRVMATALCQLPEEFEGPQASLTRAIVFEWAKRDGLLGYSSNSERRDIFLRAFDLGYLRRKLRFVSDWLNAQYDPDRYGEYDYDLTREQLQASRAAIARHVGGITAVLRGDRLVELGLGDELARAQQALCDPVDARRSPSEQATAILDDPEKSKAISDLEAALQDVLLEFQLAVLADLYRDFVTQTEGWHPEAARAVLARYLGFPYWDRVSYPYTAFSGVGDLTRIQIMRFSPNDTETVSTQRAKKLAGSGVFHFGAFFDRNGRERDYLWGRLDGAERVLALLRVPRESNRLMPLLGTILTEEGAQRGVRTENLNFLRGCVNNPGSC